MIKKENEEFEHRVSFLRSKIKELEDRIFNKQMGPKIRELAEVNHNLSIDAHCLSIQLDIYNQAPTGEGRTLNSGDSSYRNSPVHQAAGSPNHPMRTAINTPSPMGSPMSARGGHTPPQHNVVTLDTSPSYPYAQVVPTNMSPYPVQAPMGYPPMNTRMTHLSPHHEHSPARQMSLSPMHPQHPSHQQFYGYERQGSLNILSSVPPVGGGGGVWTPQNEHSQFFNMPHPSGASSQMNSGPPVPPRPSNLPLFNRGGGRGGMVPAPNRPAPPPPATPPRPNRSPNSERPRSSAEVLDTQEENLPRWECRQCTFSNHGAINECEICSNPRQGSVGNIYTTFAPLYAETAHSSSSKKSPTTSKRHHHKSKRRSSDHDHN